MACSRPLAVPVLLLLSALVVAAATAVAARWFSRDHGEAFAAATLVGTALVVAPLHALGWAGRLDANHAGPSAAALASVVLAGALLPRARAHAARARALATAWARAPVALVADAIRARHVAGLAVPLVAGVCLVTAVLAYLAPSSSWDGMWYHDTIVGFALQNRGFAEVELPPALEFVNGYPKTSELLGVWLVVFWDDRLLELPQTLYVPPLAAGVATLVGRFGAGRLSAAAWGAVVVLVPGVVLQLRSTYVDVIFAATFVSTALLVVPRPGRAEPLRAVDLVVAALGLGLLPGMKGTGLAVAPALAALLALRWLGLARRRPAIALGAAAAGLALALALAAPTYVRNHLAHANPTWPVTVKLPALGVHWRGVWAVEMPKPFGAALRDVLVPAAQGQQFHDPKHASYGVLLPWVLALTAPFGALRALVTALDRRRGRATRGQAAALLLLLGAVVPTLALSPAWYIARFNLHVLVALVAASVYGLRGRRLRPAEHAALALLVVVSAAELLRARPGWEVPPERALELASRDAEARAAAKMSVVMGEEATLLALERELGEGDVVAFTRDFGFPSVLWNRRFTNELVFVGARGHRAFLEALEEAAATWAVVREGGAEARALDDDPRWTLVGHTSDLNVAYRRVTPAPEPAPAPAPAAVPAPAAARAGGSFDALAPR